MVCNRCQKRPAIIFVQRMENGQMKNEGFCLHCARELHIKPVEDLMKQFGMSDEDMDNMENRMESMMDEMRSIMDGVPAIPSPSTFKCKSCDVRLICQHSAYDPKHEPKGKHDDDKDNC